ncbi:hypothetical protein EIP86_010911 [Pleurotus ostreatoroseus]|nr:hypothetical protein EIP86_010911 [Pleurotus ostreatoroseus]
MYKLIRRISSSFFSRPDRPWNEDATSTAPQIGQKRRHSSEDDDEDVPTPSGSGSKRHKASLPKRHEDVKADLESQNHSSQTPEAKEGEGVKEVTQGVQEVELEDKSDAAEDAAGAAAVPLPDSPVIKAQPDAASPDTTPEETAKDSEGSPEKLPDSSEGSKEIQAVGGDIQPSPDQEVTEATSEMLQVGEDAPFSAEAMTADEESLKAVQEEDVVVDKDDAPSIRPEVVEINNA